MNENDAPEAHDTGEPADGRTPVTVDPAPGTPVWGPGRKARPVTRVGGVAGWRIGF